MFNHASPHFPFPLYWQTLPLSLPTSLSRNHTSDEINNMDHQCQQEEETPFLVALPTGETFDLTSAELAATLAQTSIASSFDKSPPYTTTRELFHKTSDLSLRLRNMSMDGATDPFITERPTTPVILDVNCPRRQTRRDRETSCASCAPGEVLTGEELIARETPKQPPSPNRIPMGLRRESQAEILMNSMIYNEYGELVNAADAYRVKDSAELNVTQWLRLINKAYRHEVSAMNLP